VYVIMICNNYISTWRHIYRYICLVSQISTAKTHSILSTYYRQTFKQYCMQSLRISNIPKNYIVRLHQQLRHNEKLRFYSCIYAYIIVAGNSSKMYIWLVRLSSKTKTPNSGQPPRWENYANTVENCFSFLFFFKYFTATASYYTIRIACYRVSPVRSVSSSTITVSHPSAAAASFRPSRVL